MGLSYYYNVTLYVDTKSERWIANDNFSGIADVFIEPVLMFTVSFTAMGIKTGMDSDRTFTAVGQIVGSRYKKFVLKVSILAPLSGCIGNMVT